MIEQNKMANTSGNKSGHNGSMNNFSHDLNDYQNAQMTY